jgi:mRNA interferase MazF
LSLTPPLTRGDLVLIQFPFTDLSAQKLRPALIVGRVSGDDVIVAFISSRRTFSTDPSAEHAVGSTDAEFGTTGLKSPSLIRLNKLATLHRGLVRRRIGRIGPATQRAVARGLRYVFEI